MREVAEVPNNTDSFQIPDCGQALLREAWGRSADLSKRLTGEAALLSDGLAGGLIQEVSKQPLSAALRAVESMAAGAAIGLAASSRCRFIALPAATAGIGLTAGWLYGILDPSSPANQKRNATISSAIERTWHQPGEETLLSCRNSSRAALGPVALDLANGLLAAAAGFGVSLRSKWAPALVSKQPVEKPLSSLFGEGEPGCRAAGEQPAEKPAFAGVDECPPLLTEQQICEFHSRYGLPLQEIREASRLSVLELTRRYRLAVGKYSRSEADGSPCPMESSRMYMYDRLATWRATGKDPFAKHPPL